MNDKLRLTAKSKPLWYLDNGQNTNKLIAGYDNDNQILQKINKHST